MHFASSTTTGTLEEVLARGMIGSDLSGVTGYSAASEAWMRCL